MKTTPLKIDEPPIRHVTPKYYGYKGGYDKITKCKQCHTIGLYADCHPANPCHYCGGKVKEAGSARFIRRKPVEFKKSFWGLFSTPVITGEWVAP